MHLFGIDYDRLAEPSAADALIALLRDARAAAGARCPHCASTHLIRWGRFSGRQRYRCRGCGRTSSDLTGTALARSKSLHAWARVCACMLEGRTVRDTARRVGIHKDTAWRWRHRILDVLRGADAATLSGMVEIAETWFFHSEKGSRHLSRPAIRHGTPAHHIHKRELLWVLFARDHSGVSTADIVGTRRPRAHELRALLVPRLDDVHTLLFSSHPPGQLYQDAFAGLATRCVRTRGGTEPLPAAADPKEPLRNVRACMRRFKYWMRRFRGIASRYLSNYLEWHRLIETLTVPTAATRLLLQAARPA